jgi:hypothetical protein
MADLSNSFIQGRMDKDSDERIIASGAYRDALNITVDTSEDSNVGAAQNSLGNTKIGSLSAVSGRSTTNCKTIGAIKYERDNLIYYLIAGDAFDGIFEYNELSGVISRILQSNKATSTTASKLNFNQDYYVTGINYINGFLYWTDNLNPPRKINISRARSYNIDDARIDDDISVILAPPLRGPKIQLSTDINDVSSNNIEEKFIYFSYRYKYIDNQYSSMSPFSAVGFKPKKYSFDSAAGNNAAMVNLYNKAEIFFNTGGPNVVEVQLLMRDTRNMNISIIESFNKAHLAYGNFAVKSFSFKNNKIYTILTSDQATRLFDNVPLLAKAQEIVGNRLMYGNYTQFYDIVKANGDPIKIDLEVKNISESTIIDTPIQTFRSDRDIEIGLTYLDKYGRNTTILTSENNTTYIPPEQSITGNSLVVTIKNEPPVWATNYRLSIKQSKGSYYNIFPVIFYSSGLFKYFLINESDRDKFKVGEYVIFKSDSSGPTLKNKKYKILEFKQKSANFLGTGSQYEGLYFKIKVDSINEINATGSFNYDSQGIGGGVVDRLLSSKIPAPLGVPSLGSSYCERPIYYGTGIGSILTISADYYNLYDDSRVTIEIDGLNTFKYYISGYAASNDLHDGQILRIENVPFSIGVTNYLYPFWTATDSMFGIKFLSSGTIGDKWVVNCRGTSLFGLNSESDKLETAIVPGAGAWSTSTPQVDRKINLGAVISLEVLEDTFNPTVQAPVQMFLASPGFYENLEEWWYESNACNSFIYYDPTGINIGAKNVRFRRGKDWTTTSGYNTDFDSNIIFTVDNTDPTYYTLPIRLMLNSATKANTQENDLFGSTEHDQAKIRLEFKIQQQDTTTICETVPTENDSEIYHELLATYPVQNGVHKVLWSYADYTNTSTGLTNLGQITPGTAPTASDIPHSFSVGETIYVTSSNDSYMPSGTYTVNSVVDHYNVIIDFAFPGSGPAIPGGISYSSTDQNQVLLGGVSAKIKINNPNTINSDFNGWSFGNGLESNRIKDDFNEATIEYSVRSNAVIEGYKKKLSENAICYSGVYGINTSLDRLNEFNLSIANFKYLAKEFGSIQKLHARDTDLLAFQFDKISSVLYGKNLLYDAIGGAQVTSIPEVLGTQVAFPGENGISSNPESFAVWGQTIFCTDARRGTVLEINGDNVTEINNGMKDYFRDLMRLNPNQQKLGAYDPHQNHYVLSANNRYSLPCDLVLKPSSLTVRGGPFPFSLTLFTIVTNSSWSITAVNLGYGTNWLVFNPTSGYGTTNISGQVAVNNTLGNRVIGLLVTYCNGKTQQFTLTQGRKDTIGRYNPTGKPSVITFIKTEKK